MRILLLNQFFWPDTSATSQLLTDLARDLASQGHEVHAICAASSYTLVNETNQEDEPAVTVHRVKAARFVRGRFGRILSYGSFYLGATWCSLRISPYDVVLTLTTPPLLSLVGNLLQVLRKSKHWIWEMDVYPDVAVDTGYMKAGSLAERVVGFLADWSRRYSDGVIALGECMKERLIVRGISPDQIEVCENWADGSAISVYTTARSADHLYLLYSGNLGLAHDVDTIMGAIKELNADGRFRFLFVGSGGRRNDLSEFVRSERIEGVQMLPYVKRADLGSSLALGDIGLVTQRDACCGSVVPSKIYGLMAAGRPILFIGPIGATPARVIQRFGCGWHIACGDIAGLVALLRHLATCRDEVGWAGACGRRALLEHFDRPLGTARIASVLLKGSASRGLTDLSQSTTITKKKSRSRS